MLEDLLNDLTTGSISGGVIAAAVLAYMRWRLQRLEACIDRAHSRLDKHLDNGQEKEREKGRQHK